MLESIWLVIDLIFYLFLLAFVVLIIHYLSSPGLNLACKISHKKKDFFLGNSINGMTFSCDDYETVCERCFARFGFKSICYPLSDDLLNK